jgi:hypothetical protein
MEKIKIIILLEIALIITLAINIFYFGGIENSNEVKPNYEISSRPFTEEEKELIQNVDLTKLPTPKKLDNPFN